MLEIVNCVRHSSAYVVRRKVHRCVCSGGTRASSPRSLPIYGPRSFLGQGVTSSPVTGTVQNPVPGPARGYPARQDSPPQDRKGRCPPDRRGILLVRTGGTLLIVQWHHPLTEQEYPSPFHDMSDATQWAVYPSGPCRRTFLSNV